MNCAAWAWTFARIEEMAFFLGVALFEANFAWIFLDVIIFRGIELHGFATEFTFERRGLLNGSIKGNLTHKVLNSA